MAGIMAGAHSGGDPFTLGVAGAADIVACQFLSATGSGPVSAAAACMQQLAALGVVIQNHRWEIFLFGVPHLCVCVWVWV